MSQARYAVCMNTLSFPRSTIKRMALVGLSFVASITLLAACSSVGVGISLPVGPFGSVSIGTSSAGGVSVGAGVGVGGASVGVGGTIPTSPSSPADEHNKPKAEANLPAPAAPASSPAH
jgi:hypothetical protein